MLVNDCKDIIFKLQFLFYVLNSFYVISSIVIIALSCAISVLSNGDIEKYKLFISIFSYAIIGLKSVQTTFNITSLINRYKNRLGKLKLILLRLNTDTLHTPEKLRKYEKIIYNVSSVSLNDSPNSSQRNLIT